MKSEENLELPEQNFRPGKLQRAKREENEWSIEAVAEALHLSTHSVKAIEAGRYDELPGATYVIGYWRSYARLLGIDIEEAIEASKQDLNIVTGEAAGVDVQRSQQRKKGAGGLILLFLLIALGAFGYYAWQQQFFGLLGDKFPFLQQEQVQPAPRQSETAPPVEAEEEPAAEQVLRPLEPASESTEQPPEPAEAPAVTSAPAPEPVAQPEPTTAAPAAPSTPATTEVPGSGQSGLVMATAPVTPVVPEEESQAVQAAAPVADSTEPAEPLASAPESTPEAPQPVPAADDASTMLVKLSRDSWLDIRDRGNNRLVYKTESAGKELTVKGSPPFYIYIGTPDGVSIHYQGRNVPFETHKSGLFARFKLGDGVLESL